MIETSTYGETHRIHILVSCDENYLPPLKVMLYSLFNNNPSETFRIHFLYSAVSEMERERLERFIAEVSGGTADLAAYDLNEEFSESPTTFYYTKEMYFRLLAFEALPETIERVIYIDPDCLVLNPIRPLYEMDLEGKLFGAAPHMIPTVQSFNKVRLSLSSEADIKYYYNSGVLLMDLARQRQEIDKNDILHFIETALPVSKILPDQDLLNVVFTEQILPLDERYYNFDSRHHLTYRVMDEEWTLDHMLDQTIILHFCGKKKPWRKHATGRFVSLYKYFKTKTEQADAEVEKSIAFI